MISSLRTQTKLKKSIRPLLSLLSFPYFNNIRNNNPYSLISINIATTTTNSVSLNSSIPSSPSSSSSYSTLTIQPVSSGSNTNNNNNILSSNSSSGPPRTYPFSARQSSHQQQQKRSFHTTTRTSTAARRTAAASTIITTAIILMNRHCSPLLKSATNTSNCLVGVGGGNGSSGSGSSNMQQQLLTTVQSRPYSSNFTQPHFEPSDENSYEKTMQALDYLILKLPKSHRPTDTRQSYNIQAMKDYMLRLDMNAASESSSSSGTSIPPVIHIAGTKGKGSTCAFCESILRHCGYKTGLFTSPHLIDVRERIRINGQPVDKQVFMKHFWYCYRRLMDTTNDVFPSMATYFRFLTVLAMRIFVHEGVQVSILEVGVGGMYDSTNIVDRPVVCGITSIGMDHVDMLGENIDQIAIQKAGIMKPDCITLTTQGQKDIVKRAFWNYAMSDTTEFYQNFLTEEKQQYYNIYTDLEKCQQVINNVNEDSTIGNDKSEHKNPLYEARCDQFSNLPKANGDNNLLSGGEHQQWNAALAVAICETFIYLNDNNSKMVLLPETVQLIKSRIQAWNDANNKSSQHQHVDINNEPFELEPYVGNTLSEPFLNGVLKCTWPGRGHIVPFPKHSIHFYLDGAHTDDSIHYCTQWFKKRVQESKNGRLQPCEDNHSLSLDYNSGSNSDSDEELRTTVKKAEKVHYERSSAMESTDIPSMANILVFNYTGTRDPKDLLAPLVEECNLFDYVVFVPIDSQKTSLSKKKKGDQMDVTDKQTFILKDLWSKLTASHLTQSQQVITMDSISSFMSWVFNRGHSRVLVTGSFYMIGDFLRKLNKLQK